MSTSMIAKASRRSQRRCWACRVRQATFYAIQVRGQKKIITAAVYEGLQFRPMESKSGMLVVACLLLYVQLVWLFVLPSVRENMNGWGSAKLFDGT